MSDGAGLILRQAQDEASEIAQEHLVLGLSKHELVEA
jgi:hypothetical protein